jgi:hypothetical protein
MKYKFSKYKLNADGLFGPTSKTHFYKPVTYHNRTAVKNSDKNKWVLKQGEQYEVFKISDDGEWECKKNKGLFSILSNGDVIFGGNEERLSFFPTPQNPSDSWHGYPVDSGDYEPSSELIDKWLEEEIIDLRISIKILKGQL